MNVSYKFEYSFPQQQQKERQRMKQLLAQQELLFPNLFHSLLSALKPILAVNKCRLSIKTLSEFALKMIKFNPELYNEMLADTNKNDNLDDDTF